MSKRGSWGDYGQSPPVDLSADRSPVIENRASVFRTVRIDVPPAVYALMDTPELADLMAVLLTRNTRYSAACWLMSANAWLGGPSPLKVLDERMSDVIFAARREVDPYNGGHG